MGGAGTIYKSIQTNSSWQGTAILMQKKMLYTVPLNNLSSGCAYPACEVAHLYDV